MDDQEEQANRRRERADIISIKTKSYLLALLKEFNVAYKDQTLTKKKLSNTLDSLLSKYEKRITSFIREMLTSDDKGK